MSRPLVVAIRFDGVIATYDKNRGPREIGRPVAGAMAFLDWLKNEVKAHIIIETGRRRIDLVEKWLEVNGVKYHRINKNIEFVRQMDASEQVVADLYIGRNYVGFEGRFDPLPALVLAARGRMQKLPDTREYDW